MRKLKTTKMKKFYRSSPCSNCPFLKSEEGISTLGKERAEEIVEQNKTDGFVCHKTVDYGKEEGELDPQRRQCAGALILAQKMRSRQPFIQLHEALIGKMELKDQDKVVDTEEEFIKKQS